MPPYARIKLETAEECRANLPQGDAHLAMYDMFCGKSQLTPFQAMMNVLHIACGGKPEYVPVWRNAGIEEAS